MGFMLTVLMQNDLINKNNSILEATHLIMRNLKSASIITVKGKSIPTSDFTHIDSSTIDCLYPFCLLIIKPLIVSFYCCFYSIAYTNLIFNLFIPISNSSTSKYKRDAKGVP
jgi:hypothetical protein